MRNRKSILYMIGGSIAIIVIVAAIVISYLMSPANVYARQVASADKYFETGDYSRAILAYQEAIEKDPDSVDAYAGLANVYMEQNDNDSAIDILNRGIARTNSPRLRLMLNLLITDESEEQSEVAVDMKTAERVYLDERTLEVVGTYAYADYSSRYGLVSKQGNRDGSVTCVFNGIDAEFTFSNTPSQPDVVSATVVNANAVPGLVVFKNALKIFGVDDYITYQTLEQMHLTNLHITDHSTMGKAVQFEEKNVLVTIQSDENGTITAGADNTFVPLKSQEVSIDQRLVDVFGSVRDAQSGTTLPAVHLIVREGTYQTGPSVAETDTNGNGAYEFSLDPGEYTVEVTADGYETLFVSMYIGSYETMHEQEIIITKQVAAGEVRIVLTWNSTLDLDSYLFGTLDNGREVVTRWRNRVSGDDASLDIDDKDGYGPETTTIYNMDGDFRFVVNDFYGTESIASSGAVVTVYLPGQAPTVISIDTSIPGNIWSVFELDHGVLKIINGGNVWGYGTSGASK